MSTRFIELISVCVSVVEKIIVFFENSVATDGYGDFWSDEDRWISYLSVQGWPNQYEMQVVGFNGFLLYVQ